MTVACFVGTGCFLVRYSNGHTKRDEVTREWRKRHNEELNDPCSSPNIVRVIKSRRMRWAGHVAFIGGGERRFGVETVLSMQTRKSPLSWNAVWRVTDT